MKELDFQFKIGKFVIISNLVLFGLLCVFFFLPGFTPEELTTTLKFLVPIESVYMTAIIKFLMENKSEKTETEQPEKLNKHYTGLTRTIVYGHILFLIGTVILKALGAIDFEMFTNFVAVLETFFGAYVGSIITDLFSKKETTE